MIRSLTGLAWGLGLLAVVYGASRLDAQDLPKGEDLMDGYVKATGGKKAHLAIKSRVIKATMTFRGKKGQLTTYQKAPAQLYQEITVPGVAAVRMGYNGKTAWEAAPAVVRIHDGIKLEELKRIADMHSDVNWRDHFKSAETVKEEAVGGKAAYQVKLTTPLGAVELRYFDKKTGLLLKRVNKIQEDGKDFDFVTEILDYKKVDGLLIDSHARQTLAGQQTELWLDSVEHNVEIPANRFALPPEVKKKLKDI